MRQNSTASTTDVGVSALPIPTVAVEQLDGYDNILKMTWQHNVEPKDVGRAFGRINQVLDSSQQPVYVIVDLLQNPNFPLSETMMNAVQAYGNPRLAAWLIVGENKMAKVIESFLKKVTRRENVFWFDTETQALDHYRAVEH